MESSERTWSDDGLIHDENSSRFHRRVSPLTATAGQRWSPATPRLWEHPPRWQLRTWNRWQCLSQCQTHPLHLWLGISKKIMQKSLIDGKKGTEMAVINGLTSLGSFWRCAGAIAASRFVLVMFGIDGLMAWVQPGLGANAFFHISFLQLRVSMNQEKGHLTMPLLGCIWEAMHRAQKKTWM